MEYKKQEIAGKEQSFHAHDCDSWNTMTYCSQRELQYQKCGYCGHVVRCRYKSFWRRLRNVFLKENGEI